MIIDIQNTIEQDDSDNEQREQLRDNVAEIEKEIEEQEKKIENEKEKSHKSIVEEINNAMKDVNEVIDEAYSAEGIEREISGDEVESLSNLDEAQTTEIDNEIEEFANALEQEKKDKRRN